MSDEEEQFDFKRPDDWLRWKRRFTHYLHATGLEREDDAGKISTLLYCMGEDAEDVLTSTGIGAEAIGKPTQRSLGEHI